MVALPAAYLSLGLWKTRNSVLWYSSGRENQSKLSWLVGSVFL